MSKEIQNLNPLSGKALFTDLLPVKRIGNVEPYKVTIQQLLDFIADNIDLSNIIPKGGFKGLVQSLSFQPTQPVNGDRWVAVLPGTYQFFGGQALSGQSIGVFFYNGNSWILSQLKLDVPVSSNNTGTGTTNTTITQVPLKFRETDLQGGPNFYLDLSQANLPDYPDGLEVYVADTADAKGQSLLKQYDADLKRFYGFSDKSVTQYITVLYNIVGTGAGGNTGGGTAGNNIFTDQNGNYVQLTAYTANDGSITFVPAIYGGTVAPGTATPNSISAADQNDIVRTATFYTAEDGSVTLIPR